MFIVFSRFSRIWPTFGKKRMSGKNIGGGGCIPYTAFARVYSVFPLYIITYIYV